MSKICRECGFENEDTERICAMCMAPLEDISDLPQMQPETRVPTPEPSPNAAATVPQASTGAAVPKRYYVECQQSRKRTYVDNPSVSSYYCEGCREQHEIDGFFWTVQEEKEPLQTAAPVPENEQIPASPATAPNAEGSGQYLILEDTMTHTQIEVGPEGGVLGRYGTLGATFFQNDPRGRMVSGEHCRIRYEYGRWSIEHRALYVPGG